MEQEVIRVLTKLIPRQEWRSFCAAYGAQHRGWLVDVTEVSSGENGEKQEETRTAAEAELRGLRFEETPAGPHIAIATRDPDGPSVHSLHDPVSLHVEESETGEHLGCFVDTAGDRALMVRFRQPSRPETVDGLAPSEL
jgi:hypothetical protein